MQKSKMQRIIDRVGRHMREIGRAIMFREYEHSAGGILFPRQGLQISGNWQFRSFDRLGREDWGYAGHNLIVDQGLNAILDIALGATAKPAGFYVALYSNGVSPAANWTAANFASTAGEITSNTEGYSQTTRPQWVPAAAASGAINNFASAAAFTIECTTSVTINGAALLSNNTKGGTSGSLISAIRLGAARTEYDGNTYTAEYEVLLSDN